MDALSDFHFHTDLSDGKHSIRDILAACMSAKANWGCKLKFLAPTDHNRIGDIEIAKLFEEHCGITYVPAIEVSASDYKKLHIGGYGIKNINAMNEKYKRISVNNEMKMLKMIERLRFEHGFDISNTFIEEATRTSTLNRQTIANEIQRLNRRTRDAYAEWVGPGGKVYEETYKDTAANIVGHISDCGGIPVILHPKTIRHHYNPSTERHGVHINEQELDDLIKQLKSNVPSGRLGIECRPNSPKFSRFELVRKKHKLFAIGGTDYHAEGFIGNSFVSQKEIDGIMRRINKTNDLFRETGKFYDTREI